MKPSNPPFAAPLAQAPAEDKEGELLKVLKISLKARMDACRELAIKGTKESVPVLAALLGDEQLSHMVRYALEPIPDSSVDAVLREALGKLKGRPLVGVIASIGVRRDAQAVGALAGLLQNDDTDVVQTAARSLGKIGNTDAAKALKERMATAPAAVRVGVADGCLGCAERLMASGSRAEALGLLESVARAEVPEYVRIAAKNAAG
jgi:HEAT repeat protein